MVGQDPYGSPSAIGARTTRPQDLKWVADPNNARSYEEMKQAASTVESQVNQLKLVVHKALGGGDFDAALKARNCLLYTSPSPRDKRQSRMPSSA